MKKVIVLLFVFCFQLGFSQTTTVKQTAPIAAATEVKAQFPGGIEAFYAYVRNNFKQPTDKKFKGGKLMIQFMVNKSGTLSNITATDLGFGTKEEAIKLMTNCPKWIPAKLNGKPIKSILNIPIVLASN